MTLGKARNKTTVGPMAIENTQEYRLCGGVKGDEDGILVGLHKGSVKPSGRAANGLWRTESRVFEAHLGYTCDLSAE